MSESYLVLVIDTSGSTSDSASIKNEFGEKVPTGRTLLHEIANATTAFVSCMGPEHSLGIVSFNGVATIVNELGSVTDDFKESVINKLKILKSEGSTNTWAGIKTAANMLLPVIRKDKNAKVRIMLWTDGQSNIEPEIPSGFDDSLDDYASKTEFMPCIDIFAFGYNVSVRVLAREISMKTKGLYANVSTPDMIGTVVVNSAASWLSLTDERVCDSKTENWRLKTVEILRLMADDGNLQDMKSAQSRLLKLISDMKADSFYTFLKDLEGEVALGFSSYEIFKTWGESFAYALSSAHDVKRVANFKNSSLAIYNTPGFMSKQHIVDKTFVKMVDEAAAHNAAKELERVALLRARGIEATATVFAHSSGLNNAKGGCIAAHSVVHMADGSYKFADQIKVGDCVMTSVNYVAATVKAIVATKMHKDVPFVILDGGLCISSYHPVYDESNQEWVYPQSIDNATHKGTAETCHVDVAYSFVLNSVIYGMISNNRKFITLGHGSTDGILDHDFYGSDKVVNRIQEMNDAGGGIVNLNGWFWKEENGETVDLCKE